MAQQAVIFDLDGTLWDSWPYYSEVLAGFSSKSAEGYYSELKSGESVVRMHDRLGLSRSQFVKSLTSNADNLQLYEGVVTMLGALVQSGKVLGIVTNLPGTIAEPLIEAKCLRQYFSSVVTVRFGVARKPSPRGITICLAELGILDPTSAIYVGDTESDQIAAYSAGVQFAWASYGYQDEKIQNDYVLEKPRDLLSL